MVQAQIVQEFFPLLRGCVICPMHDNSAVEGPIGRPSTITEVIAV